MMDEIVAALNEAERDDNVRVALVQGAGRAFSTGYDMVGAAEQPHRWVGSDRDGLEDALRKWLRIMEVRLPVIAKVHGYCIAGATQLASICDVTFVSEDTKVGSGPQLPLGAGYVTAFWAWFAGAKRARRYAFPSGELITGREAAEIGLFSEAVPADQLDQHVADYVRRIARVPKAVLASHKMAANRVAEIQGIRLALQSGADLNAIVHYSPEVQDMRNRVRELGVRAAIESWQSED
jgi:enoyl-CoA hydratase